MMKIKNLLLALCLLSLGNIANSQTVDELNEFNKERINISKKGMTVLAAWSLANVAAGAYGFSTTHAEVDKNFHKMNMMWGGINLVLAATGYLGAVNDKKSYDLKKSFKQQQSIEKTFLANAALDAAYITAGLYLTERAKNQESKSAVYKGYGQSIMLQGAFLMCFDAVMFAVENNHGNKKLYRFLDKVNLSSNGIGVKFRI
ncbi:MAG: hypothetical protein IPP32_09195 [Bacteroidetes bacterium]|nr:hypothetical protein [Bacteroidota bacterium]